MRHYRRKDWNKYRNEVIELDGGVCVRCKRNPSQGVVLQVHHKEYLSGKLPWEYPYKSCETLCKGCHASEHGIVRPFSGWECIGCDDLGGLEGECELCGTCIRYVFLVQHEKWPPLEVGETCCDHLTETTEASDYMESVRRLESRRQRFIQSRRWKPGDNGLIGINQKGIHLATEAVDQSYRLKVENTAGVRCFSSVNDARSFAFDLLENGKLEAFLARRKLKA